MPTSPNYYNLLGVENTATQQEITKAYHKKALQMHPDKNPGKDTNEQFTLVGQAYAILKDQEKRKNYNQELARGSMQATSQKRQAEAQAERSPKPAEKEQETIKNFFANTSNVFSKLLDVVDNTITMTIPIPILSMISYLKQQKNIEFTDLHEKAALAYWKFTGQCAYFASNQLSEQKTHVHNVRNAVKAVLVIQCDPKNRHTEKDPKIHINKAHQKLSNALPIDKRELAKSILLGALQVLSVVGIIVGAVSKVHNNQFFFKQPHSSTHRIALQDMKAVSYRTLTR